MRNMEWAGYGRGSYRNWMMTLPGLDGIVLYSEDTMRSGHTHNWAHWREGYVKGGGEDRASLRDYCSEKGIDLPPLPDEWRPEDIASAAPTKSEGIEVRRHPLSEDLAQMATALWLEGSPHADRARSLYLRARERGL